MAIESRLHQLVDLAKEKSSDRRRELLRNITDLFFETTPSADSTEHGEFDEVLSRLAMQTAKEARQELSRRFSEAPLAPRGLILQLARDAIEVAAPILQKSTVLTEKDMTSLAEDSSQAHLKALSGRDTVPESVSDAIVRRGDDHTVAALVRNEGARLSRSTFEAVTERAESSPVLQAPLVQRENTPPDLLQDLMTVVESNLRDQIMERFDKIDPDVLEDALAASHARLEARMRADSELEQARNFINAKKLRRQLDGALLAQLLREKKMAHFCAGLAELAGVDMAAAKRAVEHPSIDPLCLICKAGGFERSLFVTLAVLRNAGKGDALRDAREYGRIYDALSDRDAQRAIRFMMLRKNAA
ncbi:DUF2336 domain-containing protein [Hyphobacterium marinum]|uniref:DUF2336 domain-containing protein n=1 Tax=Hyphobacterium marinum TaxID=3116574 RepID=A0ABU7M0K2_9PROT|nr:DUF2336 domain-containing protein [Hyphobacterium sp. Y6023]MEE2567341.1 DUF2336 domain-containing protein [Hyphobacterium sp. Y6023]